MFLYERTNINIDITNTVTEVKAVLIVFEIPLRSRSVFIERAQPNAKEIFANGIIEESKKLSTIFINKSMEPFDTIAADMLPPIVKSAIIMGINAPIILQRIFMYSVAFNINPPQILKTVTDIQRLEHSEKTKFTPEFDKEELSALNIEIKINNINTDAKFFKT